MRYAAGIDGGSSTIKAALVQEQAPIEVISVAPGGSQPLRTACDLLRQIRERVPSPRVHLGVTGTAGRTLCRVLGIEATDESVALAAAFARLYPDVRSVIGMGMESQRFLVLEPDEVTGRLRIEESTMGHKCAAGSGSFLEHMRKRLNYPSTEEFARVAVETESPATLSGRCAVFTESDIVHLYQKGTPRERIAAGVHQAICRNYVACMVKGREARPRVALIGGVALNPAVVKYLALELGLGDGALFVPEYCRALEAIGAALRAETLVDLDDAIRRLEAHLADPVSYPTAPRLTLARTEIMPLPAEDADPKSQIANRKSQIPLAALGVDIGSVSTKAALITREEGRYRVLASYYRRTNGDPLAAVRDVVGVIQRQAEERGYRFGRIVAATTGSGRYLTADYLGAELIKNEITAQANGALAFIPEVESVFEIGGQDSKYIALKDGVIVDFEMNKACAAGTGAFLEKQAATLGVPLEAFGDRALAGQNPPELDWQCTVFSESAVHHYRQNNVPVEDLCAGICMASVRNYLNKNVGSRPVGKVVAFQGAVAFNQGMVAAYETILGRRIVVPPYPHLTGAIGAAKIAYEEAPARATFRGFEALVNARYQVSSFECKRCSNRCDVNTFQMEGGEKYYYNDRCEMYSGRQKRRVQADLPDLFAEREEMLMGDGRLASVPRPPSLVPGRAAPRVGIPRIGTFNDHYPFYRAFFTALGFQVVPSDETNNRISREGVQTVAAEPCFPVKVAHGHVLDALRKGVDYLFLPAIMRAEQLDDAYCESQTCPYIQALPDLVRAALRLEERHVKLLMPSLYLKRGRRHLVRELTRVLSQSSAAGNGKAAGGAAGHRLAAAAGAPEGKGDGGSIGAGKAQPAAAAPVLPSLSRRDIERAVDAGLAALGEFRRRLSQRGEEVLRSLPQDATAFVVMGRPYTLHDAAVNMHIGRKIQDLGILAIPQDLLPLRAAGAADTWHAVYSRQIQNRLAAARLIRLDRRLRAVVLTYFGCGPDSFANQFLRDELNEPAYVMQIDEHTADAGVITRIEAFADTIRAHREPEPFTPFTTECVHPFDLNGKVLWLPDACTGAAVLAATFRAYDINARVLPRSPDPSLNLARAAIPEDVCVPALFTTEDILYRTRQPDFDPEREAFFQGNATGPCRYGMYSLLQKRILDRQNLVNVDIATLGARQTSGTLNTASSLVVWDGLVTHDLLEKMLLHTRPCEMNTGECDALLAGYVQEVCDALRPHRELVESARGKIAIALGQHLERFQDILRRARESFAAVPRRKEERPLVGLIGEFYVRIHDRANQDIIRKLERGGAEVWMAPMTEFLGYANRIGFETSGDEFRDTFDKPSLNRWLVTGFQDWLAVHDEHILSQAALPYLEGFQEMTPGQLIARGGEFINQAFGGEAICSMAKAADMVQRGVDGIVNVIPFNCMPGIGVQALSHALRRKYGNVPFLTLDYDGFTDSSRDSRLAGFLAQVRERRAARRPVEVGE
ncbi:MAG: hypothetical protein HY321_12300 [Armatimonadetes bacterium]|nr:hypothetical protein [Armatimonadota bacterium]